MHLKTLISILILAPTLACAQQPGFQDAQRLAKSLYPDLATAGSQMNSKFVEAYTQAQKAADPLLSASDWPLVLAIRVNNAVERAKNPPAEKKPVPEEPDAVVQAAKDGNPGAQALLGHWYFVGRHMPHDTAEGAEWLRKAAAQGDDEAANTLGDAYANGYIGGTKVPKYALDWFTQAAEHGYPPAIRVLSMCYDDGFLAIVQPNRAEAYKWLSLAAAYGSKDDVQRLVEFQSKMTPNEIRDGMQRIADMLSHKKAD